MKEKTDTNRRTLRTMLQTTTIDLLQSGIFLVMLYYVLNYIVVWKFENQEDEDKNPFAQSAKHYVTYFIASLVIYKVVHFVETNIANYFPGDKYKLYKQFVYLTRDFLIIYILTKYVIIPMVLQKIMKNNPRSSLETTRENAIALSLIQFGSICFAVMLWFSSIMTFCFQCITVINDKILSKLSKDAWTYFEYVKKYLILITPMAFLLEYALLITLHQKASEDENITYEEYDDEDEKDEQINNDGNKDETKSNKKQEKNDEDDRNYYDTDDEDMEHVDKPPTQPQPKPKPEPQPQPQPKPEPQPQPQPQTQNTTIQNRPLQKLRQTQNTQKKKNTKPMASIQTKLLRRPINIIEQNPGKKYQFKHKRTTNN